MCIEPCAFVQIFCFFAKSQWKFKNINEMVHKSRLVHVQKCGKYYYYYHHSIVNEWRTRIHSHSSMFARLDDMWAYKLLYTRVCDCILCHDIFRMNVHYPFPCMRSARRSLALIWCDVTARWFTNHRVHHLQITWDGLLLQCINIWIEKNKEC